MMKIKTNAFVIHIFVLVLVCHTNAKGGRGGFSSRGGGSKSSSGGWFSSSRSSPSYSRPSPSYTYSAPSPSYTAKSPSYGWNVGSSSTGSKPASSPSYGWNTGGSSIGSKPASSPSYGWNTGGSNIGSKPASAPSYGWNVGNTNVAKPSVPVGPPPAYPSLQNRPVPSNNAPPAYSPSFNRPPAYNPAYNPGLYNSPSYSSAPAHRPSYSPGTYGSSSYNNRPTNSFGSGTTYVRQNNYNTYGSNPGYYPNTYNYGYGNTFGSHGLPGNTYISNNYYGNRGSGGSGFLTNALFYGAGMHSGYNWGRSSSYDSYHHGSGYRRSWNEEEDRRWRATTQAPYFENKVPGEDKILPASAVIGAATAFGLVSLLPLNVPSNKPLMYCSNGTDLMQSQIRINNENVYQCINNTIEISCLKISENETSTEHHCSNKTMQCDLKDDEIIGSIYCQNGTLLSNNFLFCNSTTLLNGTNVNETSTILNCYEGKLPESQAAFIPTTTTTQAPTTTTAKSLSFGAKAHIFFLKLIGKGDVLMTTTTPAPEIPQIQAQDTWIPEALTIPPETTTTTTTTTEAPFVWMQKSFKTHENGSLVDELEPVPQGLLDIHKMSKEFLINKLIDSGDAITYPPHWTKIYITTTPVPQLNESSTVETALNETTTISEIQNSTVT